MASPSRVSAATAGRPGAWALLALLSGTATFVWALLHHRLLLYGDATAHLAIARRIVDSATPGLSQWGSVWLPLPHLLMTPFVLVNAWWRSGVAGSIPSLAGFVLGTWFLYRIVARTWGTTAAAWAAAFYCLNPSLLYLSAVPMTESIYLAAFLGLVDQCGQYQQTQRMAAAWCAGGWGLAASLCRYDGWFILPFAALVFLLHSRKIATPLRFCLVAGIGPLFWFLYNGWYFDDPLAFARGPYSARQIYLRALHAGGSPYPGDHALATAALYFFKTVTLTCGVPLMILAVLGLYLALRSRVRSSGRPVLLASPTSAIFLLLLPIPWYLWAMWSGNVPIFVPQYWPHGYYNLRYGVQALPAVAAFSGAAVAVMAAAAARVIWPSARRGLLLGLAVLCGVAYLLMLRPPGAIAYAEAAHNAPDRLAMEHALAAALQPWQPGQHVLMFYGTYPGALADDEIPVHDVVQESNFLRWQDALFAPHRHVDWVVVEAGSPVAKMVNRRDLQVYFTKVADLHVPSQPNIEVFRRHAQ